MEEKPDTSQAYGPEVAEQAVSAAFLSPEEIIEPDLGKSTLGRARAWILLLVMGVLWGATFSLAKIAAEGGGHPLGINFWQSMIGAIALITVMLVTGRRLPMKRENILFYMACGMLGSIIPGILFFYAASRVSPGILSITVATVPLLTFVAAAFLGIEKFQLGRILGVIFGGLSILLLVGPEESLPDRSAVPWVLVALIASVCYAGENMVVALHMPSNVNATTITGGLFIAATAIMIPFVIATGTFVPLIWPWGPVEWAIIGMAIISVAAYSMFIFLITHAGPVFASQTAYVVTFSGVFWGVLIFDEKHSYFIWVSLAIMLVALALVRPRKVEQA
ncbi:MAG: DMT family transporter [Rhodospirillaceae bacterium]|nr:DMT family transporter [Rhodospirillaceae bacterium]